jgi:hydroxymethylglutaryl-CoA synthase
LLENTTHLKAGDRIGLFSYGSGAVSEFFSGHLVDGYEKQLNKDTHMQLLDQRQKLSIEEYEAIFTDSLDIDQDATFSDELTYSIQEIKNTIRYYKEK